MQSESTNEETKEIIKETEITIVVEQPYDLKELRKDCFQLTVLT